jgi:thiol-disulfide isomerase/thioredoxin
MKNIFKIFTISLAALALFLQNAGADGTNLTAAQAWTALTNYSSPLPPASWRTNMPLDEELLKFEAQQAGEAGKFADRVRAFYTRFPDDTNAGRARTTELQALQMAIRFGATNRQADYMARVAEVIANTNAPDELRYELRIDQLGREMQARVAAGTNADVELERVGCALVKEFPNGPQGYQILIELAEGADLLKMHEWAGLMADSGGPAELTEIGKGLQRRIDAVGGPLPITFTAVDGREVSRAALTNKVVLVDFWAVWCPHCVEAVPQLKNLYAQYRTNGFEIVGINFDDDTNQPVRFVKEQEMPWPQYLGGRDNKFGKQFSVDALPSAWLVDRKGIVRDIHGTRDMAAKIAKLMAE